MVVAILIVTYGVSIIFCHYMAKNRGANAVFWGAMGAIFGPLAIPFVFLSKAGNNVGQ